MSLGPYLLLGSVWVWDPIICWGLHGSGTLLAAEVCMGLGPYLLLRSVWVWDPVCYMQKESVVQGYISIGLRTDSRKEPAS